MNDGLKQRHRAAIIRAIAATESVDRAVLFGSRATESFAPISDVDIALFGRAFTLTELARLSAAVDAIPMAQTVDFGLFDSIESRELREHIRRDGIEWFSRN